MTEENGETVPPPWEELEGWDRTLAQMMHLYIEPEIIRRQKEGLIPTPLELYAAQVLFPEDGPNRVLINEEITGEGLMRAPRDIEKDEPVLLSDLQHLARYELPDELLDCGHFTIFRSGDRWGLFFNFLAGRAKANDMLQLAAQFLETSKEAAARGHNGPAVENMFSACELASKAELILLRSPAVRARKHGAIHSEINAWAKSGNIDAAFVAYFNVVSRQRPLARYGDTEHRPPSPEPDDYDLVQTVIERAMAKVEKSTNNRDGLDAGTSQPVK